MKRIALPSFLLGLALTTPLLQATEQQSSDDAQYTSAQVRRLAREAHTAEEFGQLADYYAIRQRMYRRKAAEAMDLWAQRNAIITPLSEKWPRPVDSARNRYDYFEYEANHCAELSRKYSQMADAAAAR